MKKKFLGLFLSAIMLLASSVTAFAAGNGTNNTIFTSRDVFGEAVVKVTKKSLRPCRYRCCQFGLKHG